MYQFLNGFRYLAVCLNVSDLLVHILYPTAYRGTA
jgi:hypothetical protein